MKQKTEIARALAQQPEDVALLTHLLDRADACAQKCYVTSTRFLDLRQSTLAEQALKQYSAPQWFFHGGWERAERRVILFVPDYLVPEEIPGSEDDPIAVMRCTKKRTDTLSHRDYLGSLMGLQIKRECIGDILVSDHGADILVLREMLPFLLMNYGKAGRKHLEVAEVPIGELILPEQKIEYLRDTVASMRLDAVTAALFRLSRARAAEAIRKGAVYLDDRQCQST
ncbi:MAG: RNA-binding protein, partial [Butyricicoccaceae bacterium]